MLYDEEKISWIISDRRRAFKIRLTFIASAMLGALVVSIINFTDYLTVLCLMLEFPLMLILARLLRKYDAKVLMRAEVRGKNIKEYEYAVHTSKNGAGRIYRRVNTPLTYGNKRASAPMRINGTVYLELDDGNVTSISGLYKSHMEIYEDGDILVKYAGTRFPVVVSREVKKQPCPICGEVNDKSLDECRVCGLTIVKNRKC